MSCWLSTGVKEGERTARGGRLHARKHRRSTNEKLFRLFSFSLTYPGLFLVLLLFCYPHLSSSIRVSMQHRTWETANMSIVVVASTHTPSNGSCAPFYILFSFWKEEREKWERRHIHTGHKKRFDDDAIERKKSDRYNIRRNVQVLVCIGTRVVYPPTLSQPPLPTRCCIPI